jgi:hypothetical protein
MFTFKEFFLLETGQRDPKTIPKVLRNIPEIMNDLEGFENWFFTKTPYKRIFRTGVDDLMTVYHARVEDYEDIIGMELDEAEDRVMNDFKEWANEYLAHKLITFGLKNRKQNKQQ